MQSKEEIISRLCDDYRDIVYHYGSKLANRIEDVLRRAWNAGFSNAEERHKEEILIHEDEAYDRGYKKCLEENNLDCACCTDYQNGVEDAWETVNKIVSLDGELLWCIFSTNSYKDIFGMPFIEVYKMMESFEEKQSEKDSPFDGRYSVGDEVIADGGTACFVITSMSGHDIGGIDENGDTYAYMPNDICYKTGRHFEIQNFLSTIKVETKKEIRKEENDGCL